MWNTLSSQKLILADKVTVARAPYSQSHWLSKRLKARGHSENSVLELCGQQRP